jgi:hypothetical protein
MQHPVVVSSSSSSSQQRIHDNFTNQEEHLSNQQHINQHRYPHQIVSRFKKVYPIGCLLIFPLLKARPSAPPPQERRELKQPTSYAAYQNTTTQVNSASSDVQHLHHHQQHHQFQNQQEQQYPKTGFNQQQPQIHVTQNQRQPPPPHQMGNSQSELIQQLGAPPLTTQHPIQQSISSQNSSFQIQQRSSATNRHLNNSQKHVSLVS